LKKISIEENGESTVISYTSDNDFFKGKIESFSVTRFLLELTQHIPPRGLQYIRRYGLYASRTKGKWPNMPGGAQPTSLRLAPAGWKAERPGRAVYRLLIRYNLAIKNRLCLIKKAGLPGPG